MSHTSILQFRTANCKNCYKCIRNCPVKAIRVENQQAQILEDQCILCEKCTSVCPQHAKVEHDDIPDIRKEMAEGKKVSSSCLSGQIRVEQHGTSGEEAADFRILEGS